MTTLLDLSSKTCRWPINDGRPEYLFCGEPPAPGSPYCEAHTLKAYYQKPKNGAQPSP